MSLLKISHCVSKDTLRVTFCRKVQPFQFFKKPTSDDSTKLKNIALTCQKVNAVICKDYY